MSSKKRKSAVTTIDEQQTLFSSPYRRKLRSQKEESSPKLPEKESEKYTIKKPFPQSFALPDSIIYYITRNPTSVYSQHNLIKSCKLLYRMSRIIPVRKLQGSNPRMDICSAFAPRKCTNINLQYQSTFKLWIHHELYILDSIYGRNPYFASALTKRIYKCELQKITCRKQKLTFGELELLTSGGDLRNDNFYENVIKNADGSITKFEKVFEALVCRHMKITLPPGQQHGIGKETATNMVNILESKRTPCVIQLNNIPEIFAFQSFTNFLKNNMANRMHTIDLYFDAPISPPYQAQLQKFVNEIIQVRDNRGRGVPYIAFSTQNENSAKQLLKMRNQKN